MDLGKKIRIIEDEPAPIRVPAFPMPVREPVKEPVLVPSR